MFCPEPNVSKRQRSPSLDRATDRHVKRRHCENDHPDIWVPTESFWDTLPRIHLTRRALAEHDHRTRRQNLQPQAGGATTLQSSTWLRRLVRQTQLHGAVDGDPEPDLQRLARGGGPDLTSIRGYPDPTMSDRTSHASKQTSSRRTSPSKRSGPYDANYQLKLAQAGVHLMEETDENDDIVMPANYDDIIKRLDRPRRSLSPSRFSEKEFLSFRRRAGQELLESETMKQSLAIIEGAAAGDGRGERILSQMSGPFNNLEPIGPDMAMAVPDSYDGALPLSIDDRILKDLDQYIVPNTDTSRPCVPNFFLEGKGRKGTPEVALRQAAHTGAIGARGVTKLQSYPNSDLYDGKAYAFTNTYQDGFLKMYTTHATPPRAPDNHPSYHMTLLSSFAMTQSSKSFREGATFYRNARDLAKGQRHTFIQQANQAARHLL